MTFGENSHLGSEVLELYALRHLSDAECKRLEDHLLFCEECQDELAKVQAFISDMKAACSLHQQTHAAQSEPRPSRWFGWFDMVPRPAMAAALAAVLLAVGIPVFLRESTPAGPFAVQLTALRGPDGASVATAERGRSVRLEMRSAELPPAEAYRIEVVDTSGERVWSGAPRVEGGNLVADVNQPLSAGNYWVRLLAQSGNPVREFGLSVK